MNKFKEYYEIAKTKLVENKETVIRVSAVLIGAVIGGVVTTMIKNQQMLNEEITMSLVDMVEDN